MANEFDMAIIKIGIEYGHNACNKGLSLKETIEEFNKSTQIN